MTATLRNEYLELVLDARGNLASLRNRRTDWEYIARPGLDGWRLIYAHPDDPETPVSAARQAAPEITAEPDCLRIRYPTLVDDAQRAVEATLTLELRLAGEEIVATAAIENRGAPQITELWFPLVNGLGSLGPEAARAFLLYPESAGRRIQDPLRNLADRNAQPVRGVHMTFLRDLYPGRAAMQWLGLYGTRGSLYLGSHDATLQTTAVNAMLNVGARPADDSLALGFIKYPFVSAGAAWQSQPFVIAVHARTWHADARRYRRFADSYQDHRRAKAGWVETMPGLHDVILLHQNGVVNFRYEDIHRICAAAAAGGLDTVKLTGWSHGGHDNQYPDFQPAPRLGGETELREHIRRARAAGSRIVQYFHFVQMSPNSEFYRRHGEFCALKSPAGHAFIDVFTWPGRGSITGLNERMPLINACVGTAPWQEQVLDGARRGLDYGADCIFLDQTAGAPSSFLCFDARHGHPTPAFACGPGKTELSRRARELVKAAGDDRALGAEYIADVILQFYDFTIPFGMGFFYGGQHFGDMYRFTFPEDIICSQYISREDYRQLHYAFAMGYRFFLTPRQQCGLLTDLEPAFVERLRALVALRRRHGDVLMRGRFLGDEPLTSGGGELLARAFESPSGAAVTLWNPTTVTQPVQVEWPGRLRVAIDTPSGARDPGAELVLAPDEVAVCRYR